MPAFDGTSLVWLVFAALVLAVLIVDLGYLHRQARVISFRESALVTAAYVVLAVLFGGAVWWATGADGAASYYTAYVVEQSLSIDNVFVMSVIFGYFGVPRRYRHRVLFWGILGAIVFRGILLGFGAAAVAHFDWLVMVFGGLLIATGIKLALAREDDGRRDIGDSLAVRFLSGILPMTPRLYGHRFFVRRRDPATRRYGGLLVTPLFFALVVIEVFDIVFAIDSIPAVLAISQNPLIVFTSNVFAILNLRALYFVLDAIVAYCRFLRPALAAILIFIGAKIFYQQFIGDVSSMVSLGVTLLLLGGSVLLSLVFPRPAAELSRAAE